MSYEQNKRADERNLSVKPDNTVLTHSNYADQKCIHFQKFHFFMIIELNKNVLLLMST